MSNQIQNTLKTAFCFAAFSIMGIYSAQAQVDMDGDSLIDITTIEQLYNIRFNLAGTSYKTDTSSDAGLTTGCPGGSCIGYELINDLDFDTDGDGSSWTDNGDSTFTIDNGDTTDYFIANKGWLPIGYDDENDTGHENFNAIFEGNGFRIKNLAIARNLTHIGLFARTGSNAILRNVGLDAALADYTGSSNSSVYIGPFAGRLAGMLLSCDAHGAADAGGGSNHFIGGLVGELDGDGSIVSSYATVSVYSNGANEAGGLVGRQSGNIVASYATGNVNGGGGYQQDGGLVGRQNGGSIVASYATGNVSSGSGYQDVGGLVGNQGGGSILACYALGTVNAGSGGIDYAGGLVGSIGGTITSSYFSGTVDGGSDGGDVVGRLAGNGSSSNITKSYGFGTIKGKEADGIHNAPASGQTAPASVMGLTPAHFGDNHELYYDFTVSCDLLRLYTDAVKKTLVGGQTNTHCNPNPNLSSTVLFKNTDIKTYVGTISVLNPYDSVETLALSGADKDKFQISNDTLYTNDFLEIDSTYDITINATGISSADFEILVKDINNTPLAYDSDGDGLIDIKTIEQLYNIRYNLAGTSYKTGAAATDVKIAVGCPGDVCKGYELMNNLDFDIDNSGGSWKANMDSTFTLDIGDTSDYFIQDKGWLPIGYDNEADATATAFTGIFEGNGYVIENLAVQRDKEYVSFIALVTGGEIRNLGMDSTLVNYTGNSNDEIFISPLLGRLNGGGKILSCYAGRGHADGGSGDKDLVGGLVSYQLENTVIDFSYATGSVNGGSGLNDLVGGLVARQDGSSSSITASYSTAAVDGGAGGNGNIGGLVGLQLAGTITASYTTGSVKAGADNGDHVGGLVGYKRGNIVASYALGTVDGGDGSDDKVGALVGTNNTGDIISSYGFGTIMGKENDGVNVAVISGQTAPADLFMVIPAHFGANSSYYEFLGSCPPLLYSDSSGTTLISGQEKLCKSNIPVLKDNIFPKSESSSAYVGRITLFKPDGSSVKFELEGTDADKFTIVSPDSLYTTAILESDQIYEIVLQSIFGVSDTISTQVNIFVRDAIIDNDGDGLIDISNIAQLYNIRYNLSGTNYKIDPIDNGGTGGCPNDICIGYELMNDLDFDIDNSGGSWKANMDGTFTLDIGDTSDYFIQDKGWLPIGYDNEADATATAFTGIFEGNGYVIKNLAVQRDKEYVSFMAITNNEIRNLGMDSTLVNYTGNSNDNIFISPLSGRLNAGGKILSCYARRGHADGGSGNKDLVGGLVSYQLENTVIDFSYATGSVNGGSGLNDLVGGLVGRQDGSSSSITASYSTVAVDGGAGGDGNIGGLVGLQLAGTITASYTSGSVKAGAGNGDHVGGLVGFKKGNIVASYALGTVDGGDGSGDNVGALVGTNNTGDIISSYGFGTIMGKENDGVNVAVISGQTAPADLFMLIPAHFGANSLYYEFLGSCPPLLYSDNSGTTLISGQEKLCKSNIPVLNDNFFPKSESSSAYVGRITLFKPDGSSVKFELEGTDADKFTIVSPDSLYTTAILESNQIYEIVLQSIFGVSDTISTQVNIFVRDAIIDNDGDGLIDISNIAQLYNIRYNLSGTNYKIDLIDNGGTGGCPNDICIGYELVDDINFDIDGNGRTWVENGNGTFTLDIGDTSDYFIQDKGWLPIGYDNEADATATAFTGIFEGNGYVIKHLAVQRDKEYVSFMASTNNEIRNLGMDSTLVNYTGNSNDNIFISPLSGRLNAGGKILSCYARRGHADGGSGNKDLVGGLVGYQLGNTVIDFSYATGSVNGGSGLNDLVGGLVARQDGSSSSITASYSTVAVDGGAGGDGNIGGLVGLQLAGIITASYTTGSVKAGAGNGDHVGGLVGFKKGDIVASYALGTVDGGDGSGDNVGALVGNNNTGDIISSYGFGTIMGKENDGVNVAVISGQTAPADASGLTAAHFGANAVYYELFIDQCYPRIYADILTKTLVGGQDLLPCKPNLPTLNNTTLFENTDLKTLVGTIASTDPNGDAVTFAVDGAEKDNFLIANDSLYTNTLLKYSPTDSIYEITIHAIANGDTTSVDFEIVVKNVNDAPTGITLTSVEIAENNILNAVIGTLSTTDADIGDTHTYTLSGTDATDFSISTDKLLANIAFDFETKSSYSIQITTTDAGGLLYDSAFTIEITDVNEAPTVEDSTLTFSASEASQVGTFVGNLGVTDPENDTLSYTFTSGNTNEAFSIDSISGDLLVKTVSALDFETNPTFTLTVEVSDGEFTAEATITIEITDVNEAPTAENATLTFSASEASTFVGNLGVTDPDGDALIYTFTSGNTGDAFSIDSTSGDLLVKTVSALDITPPVFTLEINISDGELSDSVTITVNITDNKPPVVVDQSFEIDEASEVGTAVGTVVATDPEGETLSYSITNGNTGEAFSIDSISGDLLVKTVSALDFETNPTFALTVEVSDGVLLAQATITVNIIENKPPVVAAQSFEIDEASEVGTAVGTVTATDPEGETLSYSITDGNTDEAFSIDSNTGEITVKTTAALDFETNPTFVLTVEVSDGNSEANATITVTLTEVIEEITGINDISTEISIYPNPANAQLFINYGDLETSTFTVQVLNTTGKVVIKEHSADVLDISSLQKGVYVLKIKQGEKVKTVKFLKQ